jgi:hypothetical protein
MMHVGLAAFALYSILVGIGSFLNTWIEIIAKRQDAEKIQAHESELAMKKKSEQQKI